MQANTYLYQKAPVVEGACHNVHLGPAQEEPEGLRALPGDMHKVLDSCRQQLNDSATLRSLA